MNSDVLLPAALLIPLAAALLVAICGRWPNLREAVSLLAGGALFACSALLLADVAGGARPELLVAEPLPGLAMRFELEPLGATFAALASFLWIVTTIYSIGYMRGHGESHQTRFYACFAVALHAVMGAAASGNLLTLFFFYELLTISTYPLVTHSGTPRAQRGGRVYLGVLLATSIGLLLLAVVWTYALAGRGDFEHGGLLAARLADGTISKGAATALFCLFAFGIGKAALMPVHRWLPAAMVAPTPVSALLHAVAVVKTGVFALLKVAVYVFGLDGLRETGASLPVAWVAAATMLIASLVALTRDNLKERLAYSTIGQLSYIVLGTASADPSGAIGAGLHLVTHAFGKITLFFAAGAVLVAAHRAEIRFMGGLGRFMPFTFVAFALASCSIVGMPPFGGVWSKWWLGAGLAGSGHAVLLGVLFLSSLLSAVYLLPVAVRAFAPKGGAPHALGEDHPGHEPGEAPLACRIAMGVTVAGSIAIFFFIEPLRRLLEPIVTP